MPQTALGHRFRFAAGAQSAEGTAQGTPEYEVPLLDNSRIAPAHDERELEASDSTGLPQGYFIARADWGGSVVVPGFPDPLSRFWKWHLGTDTITGSADPFLHTITEAPTKPFVTSYLMSPGLQGGTDFWERGVDGFIKAVQVDFTKGEPLRHTLEFVGKTWDFGVAAPSPTNIVQLASNIPYYTMHDASLQLDVDGATVAQVRNIESGTIRSAYEGAQFIQTDTVTPRYLAQGRYSVTGSLTMVLEDFDAYRNALAGGVAGTALSHTVTIGRLVFRFLPQDGNTNREYTITITDCRFDVDAVPAPDISGDAVRITLALKMAKPASGNAISVAIENGLST